MLDLTQKYKLGIISSCKKPHTSIFNINGCFPLPEWVPTYFQSGNLKYLPTMGKKMTP